MYFSNSAAAAYPARYREPSLEDFTVPELDELSSPPAHHDGIPLFGDEPDEPAQDSPAPNPEQSGNAKPAAEPTKKGRPKKEKRTPEQQKEDRKVIELFSVLPLTDLGNAKRFVREHGEELRWVPQWKSWVRWSGTHWATITDEETQTLAQAVVEGIQGEAQRVQGKNAESIKEKLEAHGRKSESSKSIAAMIKEAKALLTTDASLFDRNPWLYNTLSGTLDLERKAKTVADYFRPHEKDDYITKCVDLEWNPEAKAPRFDLFMGEIFANCEDTATYVKKTMATCLVGKMVEQSFHLWFGRKGRNGKGVLQRVLNRLTTPYKVTVDPKLFFASFKYDPNGASSAIVSLRNARLVIGSEMSKEDVVGGTFLKRYTGEDEIPGRDLHEKARDTKLFFPTGTPIISTNHFPQVDPTDDALWARLKITEFPVHFGGPNGPPLDSTLEATLEKEMAGILVRVLEAWMLVQAADPTKMTSERGLLNAPDSVLQTTKLVRSTFGPIGLFIYERCITGPAEKENPQALYEAYLKWAYDTDKGEEDTLSPTKFGTQLTLQGYKRKESNGKGYRVGLRLKTDEERGLVAQTSIPMNYKAPK